MKQAGMTMTDYYSTLTGIWSEINHYQNTTMIYLEDSTTHSAFVERDRIFDFLASFNLEYNQECIF